MAVARPRDEPWRRLPWLLPPAILLAFVVLAGFLRILIQPPERPPLPRPVDVALVELPAPAAPPQAAPQPEIAPPMEEPLRTVKPELPPAPRIVLPKEARPPEPQVEARPEPLLPPPPPPKIVGKPPPPKPAASRQPRPPSPQPLASAQPPSDPVAAPAAPVLPSAPPAPSGVGTTGARAIFQPMPEIPEELRRRRLDAVAVVLFHVRPDGSAAVELRQATDDPRLNQALLDGFKRWRFFPALDHDMPVASILELRVPVQVR